jgi:hypothetical protein
VCLEILAVAALAYAVAQVLDNRIEVLESIVAFVLPLMLRSYSFVSLYLVNSRGDLGITALRPTLPGAL